MAGRLRHLVTVQSQSTTQDGAGQRLQTWTTVTTAWADIKPVSGRDFYAQSGEHADITHEIEMRYGTTVSPGNRAVLGSRTFDIRSVLNVDERNRYLTLMAVENAG